MRRIPIDARSITSADPPYEINGSGTPVSGRSDVIALKFTTTCIPMNPIIPPANNLPKLSFARPAIKIPRQIRLAKTIIKITDPINPTSSAIIGKL